MKVRHAASGRSLSLSALALALMLGAPSLALAQAVEPPAVGATPGAPAAPSAQPFFSTPASPVVAAPAAAPAAAPTFQAPPLVEAQATELELGAVPVFGRSLFQGRFAQESFKEIGRAHV
jgi:hypothetical protein